MIRQNPARGGLARRHRRLARPADHVFAAWSAQLDVELPLSPRALASFTANLFQGIEVEMLAGVPEDEAPHREVLDAVGALIAQAEAAR